MIENSSFPLAGWRENDIKAFFTELLRPYTGIIIQIQAALLFHNIPLYCVIVFSAIVFIYLLSIVVYSDFPTIFYFISVIPVFNAFLLLGGKEFLHSLCVELPDLPVTSSKRIRSLDEIVSILWRPLLYVWRVVFFIYRMYLCPNIVDISVFLVIIAIIGLLLCVVNGIVVLSVNLIILLTFPGILTRDAVYHFIIARFGHSIPEDSKID